MFNIGLNFFVDKNKGTFFRKTVLQTGGTKFLGGTNEDPPIVNGRAHIRCLSKKTDVIRQYTE